MEKEKMQRIIGMMVIAAFVIIILPLLFGKSDLPLQAKNIPAPPFPDQPADTVAVADNAPKNPVQEASAVIEITPTEVKELNTADDHSKAQPVPQKAVAVAELADASKTQPPAQVVSTPAAEVVAAAAPVKGRRLRDRIRRQPYQNCIRQLGLFRLVALKIKIMQKNWLTVCVMLALKHLLMRLKGIVKKPVFLLALSLNKPLQFSCLENS